MSSTDARATARRYYATYGRNMEADMAALAGNPQGVAVYTPRLVALVRPVLSTAPQRWLDLAAVSPGSDAWYIHLLCGDVRYAAGLAADLPELRWAVFQRGARSAACHRCPWRRLLLLLNH